MLKIGFLGGGKMAQALAKGFISAGLAHAENICASCAPQDVQCIDEFQKFGAYISSDNQIVVQKCNIVFIAVKPSIVPIVLSDIKPVIPKGTLLLSIAMGISIDAIEKALPSGIRVIRVMPNTPCTVGSGASVFSRGSHATDEDVKVTKLLLSAVGTCDEAPESYLDPVTALSGSGAAYIYLIIEALSDGGVKMGLPRDLSTKLAAQTVIGAGRMVVETKIHPGQLKDDITSPGGTTITGLHVLENGKVRGTIMSAIEEATKKGKETREQLNKQ